MSSTHFANPTLFFYKKISLKETSEVSEPIEETFLMNELKRVDTVKFRI